MKKQFGIPVLVALLAVPAAAIAQSDAERIADLEKRVESLVKKDRSARPPRRRRSPRRGRPSAP